MAAVAAAFVVHPTTALWFGVWMGVALIVCEARWRPWLLGLAAVCGRRRGVGDRLGAAEPATGQDGRGVARACWRRRTTCSPPPGPSTCGWWPSPTPAVPGVVWRVRAAARRRASARGRHGGRPGRARGDLRAHAAVRRRSGSPSPCSSRSRACSGCSISPRRSTWSGCWRTSAARTARRLAAARGPRAAAHGRRRSSWCARPCARGAYVTFVEHPERAVVQVRASRPRTGSTR